MAKDKDGNEIVDNSIPKQVRENAQAAEDLMEQMNADKTPPADDDEVPPAGDEEDPNQPAEEAGDPPADTSKGEEEEGELSLQERFDKLTAQHDTLKGKYKAEAPGENSRADKLQNQLDDLKSNTIKDLMALSKPAVEEPATDVEPDEAELKRIERAAKFQKEYGEEYVAELDAHIMGQVNALVAKKVGEVEVRLSKQEEKQVQAVEDKFVGGVNGEITEGADWVNDWTKEGNNPEFEAFLKQPDPTGFHTNAQLADMLSERGDTTNFAKLLNTFYAPEAPSEDPAPKTEKTTKPAAKPDHMVAPSRTTPVETPADQGEKIVWTNESMAAFYEKDRKKGYTPEESEKLWADILLAPHQGRIQ